MVEATIAAMTSNMTGTIVDNAIDNSSSHVLAIYQGRRTVTIESSSVRQSSLITERCRTS
ncbi:hypothetical protein CCR75_001662 [Bremia lactucae]|uniref:Uncharacterized protein n=1 Tax=Bremia lactucae TaxID=4779 RepID=A0A976FNP6_BRELC|nr:hypothetical protein CCR75_001662 [Bremia lactucae]